MKLSHGWRRIGQLINEVGGDQFSQDASGPATNMPGSWVLVALASLWGMWSLRAECRAVAYPNDSGMHLQMTSYAHHLLAAGVSPFDHWYPLLSLGSPFFVQYQSLSAVLVGALGAVGSVPVLFAWSLYLLLALWPLCVYGAARLATFERWPAATAAAAAPFLFSVTGRGFGHQSYIWIGSGLWSQLFAMWTLPLAWALTWRWVARREHFFGALVAVSGTVALHFLTGYLAALSVGVWVLIVPSQWRSRGLRALVLALGVGLCTLWVTLPIVLHSTWLAVNQFQVGTTINNSYGAPQVLDWLATGQLFDWRHAPALTVLLACGVVSAVTSWRRDERSRFMLGAFALSLVLFCGRPTFTWLIALLPGNSSLLLQRYLMGVQLAGLLLIGVGAVRVAQLFVTIVTRQRPVLRELVTSTFAGRWRWLASAGVVALTVAVLMPAAEGVTSYDHSSASFISAQAVADTVQGSDVKELVAIARAGGGGRIYAGMPSNWGHSFYVGQVPVYIYLEQLGVDAVGFTLRTTGLMTDPEAYFDEDNLSDYATFGIRYALIPAFERPTAKLQFIARRGDYSLWRTPPSVNSALVQVVDTVGVISATNATLGPATRPFLASNAAAAGHYPTIAFAGAPAGPSTVTPRPTDPGRVVTSSVSLDTGESITAVVSLHRTAVVLAKVAFDPGWHVTIDGVPARTIMLAPALEGVVVPAGPHTVVFTYHGFAYYPETLLAAAVTLGLVGCGPWWWRRRRDVVRP